MRRKRTGNTWRFIAAFALSTVLILDGLSPAWSTAAGPESLTDRSYQDAGYAGPYGLARFISGNGAAGLEALLFDVLGEGQTNGAQLEQEAEEDIQDVSGALDEAAVLAQASIENADLAALEKLGWDENTDMSQRLVGSWGSGAGEEDGEHLWSELDGFEGEWIEEPDGLGASSDSMDAEWLDDGWYEDDWREERGHGEIEEDGDFLDDVGNKMETLDIEPDADENIGADRGSARMPAWKAHSHNQEREGRREIAAGTNRNGFIDDGGETSNSISADGADGDSSSNSGSSDDSQDSETPPSGNDGSNGDGQGPEENSGGGYEEGSENPDENDDDNEDGSENNGDSDEDLDNDDKEGNDAGDQSGDGDEKNNEEVVEDDEEQKDPMQEEPAVYISSEGVWDGSIAASFAGGTGTASDPYLISNGAELAYLAQQVNSGTTYSGKYFLQTGDIILNQNVMRSGAVQGPVLKDEDINDENLDVEQDMDEPEEDGVVGDMGSESETSDEAENVRSDELSSHNGEAENDAKVSRAVSSATTAPEDKWSANDGDESESNGDANVKNDLDEAEGDSHLEEESNDEKEDEEKEDEQQTHSLRTGNEPLAWTPIGYYNSRSFQGTYDGDGFEISGIYINTADDYQGLFGYANGTVKNIQITNTSITGGSYVGGIAGYARWVENCRNYGRITGKDYVGGLAGRAVDISDGVNEGEIQAAFCAGGLAGDASSIAGSRNEGSVTVEGQFAGGLGGYVSSGITDSINTADVKGGSNTGGLAGYTSWTISGSINYGSVAGDSLVGGLAGHFQKGTVEDSRNEGNVSGGQITGGILGFTGSNGQVEFVQIRDCSSSGDVRASGSYAGGILGQSGKYKSIEMEGCIYEGTTVSGSGYVGGIAGHVVGSVVNCVSSVDIHAPEGSYVGGIAGYAEEMKNCRNYGSIEGKDFVGGLAGRSSSISESTNVGAVQAASYGGGLAGNVNGTVSGSRNEGSVTVQGQNAGGLGGYVSSGITDSVNTADVRGGSYTGGLAGYTSWTISGSINYGSVAGDSLVGGLAGHFQKGTVEDCRNEGNVSGGQITGGILGFTGSNGQVEFVQIRDCSSSGDVRASGSYAGGILGQSGKYKSIEMEGCIYEGNTVSGSGYVGGIAGHVVGSVVNCVSSVDIHAPEGSYVGGIAGYAEEMKNCRNYGSIEGKDFVGGLAGRSSSISESTNVGAVQAASYGGGLAGNVNGAVSGSWNEGSVTVQGQNAGGLGGYVSSGITDSVNTADVRGGSYTGGLAGYTSWTISGSINYGSVAGDSLVGGLAGHFQKGTVEDSRNEGNVSGGQITGGILGFTGSNGQVEFVQIRDCSSSGDVRASGSYAGGILGQSGKYKSIEIEGCIYEGNTVSGSGYVGGIAGHVVGSIVNCVSSVDIHAPEGSYVGGIAGYAEEMKNCRNYGSIEGKDFVGGIAGRTSSISESINEGAVQAASYAGGLAGNVESTIESCENYGTITSGSYTGGIAGYAGTAAGCENYGMVQGETYTGGIAGQAGTLQDCRNEGIITGGEGTGGIAGLSGSGGVSRCINLGEVSGSGKGTGGIIGTSSSTNSILYACENQADIAGAQGTGGILGSAGRTLRIEYSRNSGTVQGGDHTGGILGSAEGISGTIAVCINEGPLVSGGLGTGGIAGYTNFTISESINRGEAAGTGSYIGSIAGRAGTLKDIVNNTDITGTRNYTGGLAGYADRTENCYNTGAVTGAGTYVGGIAGQLVTAVDCTNKGAIQGRDYVGGIAGDGKDLSGCWNTGSVQGDGQGTGGIAGYSSGRIEDCHNSGSVNGGISAGGIAGSQLGTVSRSRNMGMVSADSDAGGIAGFKLGGAVEKSLNTGYVLFQERGGGGIAGAASSTQIRDSYSLGAVTGRGEGAGGIAGRALSSVRIINCYNTGIITGRGYTGGLAGFSGSGLSLTNSYYIRSTAGTSVGYEWGEEEPDLTLEEMSMRVSSSDLKGMASDLGSAYARDRQEINGGYPILVDVDYTSQPPQIGARPSPFSLGYGEFAVTAVEKMSPGSALEGAQVDLGSFGSEETDSNGTAVFSVGTGGGRHYLDVELEGYRRYFGDIQLPYGTNPHMIDNNSQFLAMLTPLYPDDSTVPYISTLMYYPEGERTVDVLTSSVNILTGKKAELVMNAEWNGKTPGSYVLFQLNGARLESSSGIFSEKLGDHFLPGEAIYAQVRAADNTMGGGEATGIQLVWGDTEKYVVSFFDGTAVKLPGFIPIPDIIPNITGIDVEVEFDDTKIRVYVGVKDTEVKRRLTELKKEAGGYGMENVKRILRSSTLREKMNWGTFHIDMRLLGYAEWRMEQKNFLTHPLTEPFVFKGDVGAIGEFKAKVTHTGLYMAGPVPLYYRLGAGFNLDTELSAYVDLQRGIFETKDELTITPEVGAEGGVGLPDLLSGGLDLAVKVPLIFNQDREGRFSLDKAKLTGKANLKAAILGFVVEQDLLKMFFGETPEKIFYDRDKKGKEAALSAASLIDISPMFDAAQFKPNPMEYTKSGSEWMAGAASESMTAEAPLSLAARMSGEPAASAAEAEALSGEHLLQTNINQESRPQTASIPGMTIAAWTVNDTSRGVSANWPLLVYSVLDEAAGTWSTPAAVLDDGTGDFYPVLKEGGGSIWISWQNAGKAFVEAPQSLEELAGELEAAAAVFDAETRTFAGAGNITDNAVMDLMPVIAVDGEGRSAAVWRTNSAGDLFGTSGTTSIWAMDLQTEKVQKLWETEKPVVSMDAGYRNGMLTAAVVSDGDGDLSTADDRSLYLLSAGAAPVQAAGDSMIGGAPVFSRYKDQSVVFYSTGGMLKALFENGSEEIIWAAEMPEAESAEEEYAASPGIGDFSAAYDAEGRAAVIWTGMQENMTMQTQILLYDSSRDEWSRELRTEGSSGSVVAPSATFGSDGTLRVLYGRMTEDSITGMEQMDLCLAELVSEYGIAVEEIWYDPYDEIPGEDLPVGLVVSNTGSITIEQIVVDINGEETVLDMHLLPGEEVELQVMHPVGSMVEPAALPVKVSALDEAGSTAASDSAEFAVGYADAELSVQEVTNAWGQTAVITAGSRSWNSVNGTLEIRLDSAEGPVIERINLGALSPDQTVHYSYGVPDDLRLGGRAEKLYFVLRTDQPELFMENNIDYINLI